MARFDLTTEAWIPVVDLEGRSQEVGLRECLKKAHGWREIFSESPLETVSLNRLLLALAVRIFTESSSKSAWFAMWEKKEFDAGKIDAYFDTWAHRFDLLDKERPFYQHTSPMASEPSPLARLFSHESRGNNPTLFDHTYDRQRREMSLAQAARGIVATQGTALVDGVSKPIHCFAAPIVDGGIVFWMRGHSLFEALMLNAPPIEEGRMNWAPEFDEPAWETKNLVKSEQRALKGYLDYLTWQTRRLLLKTEEKDDGTVVATQVWVSAGDAISKGPDDFIRDPLMAYSFDDIRGVQPLRLRQERAVWRDYPTLLGQSSSSGDRPPIPFAWLARYREKLPDREWSVNAFGIVKDKANLRMWRAERLPFFPEHFHSRDNSNAIQQALDDAKFCAHSLWSAVQQLGAYILFPNRTEDGKLSPDNREKVKDFLRSLAAEPRYWTAIEIPFYSMLEQLASSGDKSAVIDGWRRIITTTAFIAFEHATSNISDSAQQYKGLAAAESSLESELSRLTSSS